MRIHSIQIQIHVSIFQVTMWHNIALIKWAIKVDKIVSVFVCVLDSIGFVVIADYCVLLSLSLNKDYHWFWNHYDKSLGKKHEIVG